MKNNLTDAIAVLRLRVEQNRGLYRGALQRYRCNRWDCDRDAMVRAHARLAYLVPLYRALRAAAQQDQSRIGGEKGAQLYIKRFTALLETLRWAALYPSLGMTERHFGDGLLWCPVLVPQPHIAPSQWEFRKIGELLDATTTIIIRERDGAQAALRHRAKLALEGTRAAEQARAAFLASLTDAQRQQLRLALDEAGRIGSHAIHLDNRDLVI